MQTTTLPTKFPIPFANSATGGYIRPIPQASQISIQAGAASLTDGFPPVNFLPVAAGGTPPFGQDHNGILNQITAWIRALTAGLVVPFDAGFQAAIGGYPFKARVLSGVTAGLIWESQIDNNLSNPDTGGANWSVQTFVDPSTAGLIIAGSGASGANLKLQGIGGAAPAKWVRATNGHFQVINNGYTSSILDIDDAGNATFPTGSVAAGIDVSATRNVSAGSTVTGAALVQTSAGNIVANGGRLRANFGAYGSSDANCATILSDFTFTGDAGAWWARLPNGFLIEGGAFSAFGSGQHVTFPMAFPSTVVSLWAVEANASSSWAAGNPTLNAFSNVSLTRFGCDMVCLRWNAGSWAAASGQGVYWMAIGQ